MVKKGCFGRKISSPDHLNSLVTATFATMVLLRRGWEAGWWVGQASIDTT